MKALVYHGPGQKAWEEVPDPSLQDDTDAIVRIDTVTICGTDLHILKGDVPTVTEGRILGHEAVGTIEAVGAGLKAPPDARVIDGTGLVVTPGLIDAYGGLGLPAPPRKGSTREASPKPEAIAPQRNALERVQAAEALKARNDGITTALVIPSEGVLPGRSVLLDLVGEKAEGMAVPTMSFAATAATSNNAGIQNHGRAYQCRNGLSSLGACHHW